MHKVANALISSCVISLHLNENCPTDMQKDKNSVGMGWVTVLYLLLRFGLESLGLPEIQRSAEDEQVV